MDVRLDGDICVKLSQRNLNDLARQAAEGGNPWTDGTIVVAQLVRSCEQPDGSHLFLRVQVEPDNVHYGDRTPGPGVYGSEEA